MLKQVSSKSNGGDQFGSSYQWLEKSGLRSTQAIADCGVWWWWWWGGGGGGGGGGGEGGGRRGEGDLNANP